MKKIDIVMPKPTQPADMDIQGGSVTESRYERFLGIKGYDHDR